MTELLVADLARTFWELAGTTEPFPRELRRPTAWALPVAIVDLPRLRVAALGRFLERRTAIGPLATADRPLRAALVAHAGQGFVFIDGADPPDERRFSLAHELAHFLADYWWPRRRAAARVGPASLEVLDGRRGPTRDERIDAALGGVALAAHVHLMERTPDGHRPGEAIERAEQTADALALELLAPGELAAPLVAAAGGAAEAEAVLAERFGLPSSVARVYREQLLGPEPPGAAMLRRLGLADVRDVYPAGGPPSHFVEARRKRD